MANKTLVGLSFSVDYDPDTKQFTVELLSPGILEDRKTFQLPAFLKMADLLPDSISRFMKPMHVLDFKERIRAALLKAEPDYRTLFQELAKPEARARLQWLIDNDFDATVADDVMHYEEIYNRLIR